MFDIAELSNLLLWKTTQLTLNTQLYPANIESLDDVAQILLNGQTKDGKYPYDLLNSYKGFDDEYLYIFVRLQADGIPFAHGTIISPS